MDRPSRIRRGVLTAASLALLLAAAPPARGQVEVGAEAPDVTAQDFINTEPISLKELLGRVVFLELFTTT